MTLPLIYQYPFPSTVICTLHSMENHDIWCSINNIKCGHGHAGIKSVSTHLNCVVLCRNVSSVKTAYFFSDNNDSRSQLLYTCKPLFNRAIPASKRWGSFQCQTSYNVCVISAVTTQVGWENWWYLFNCNFSMLIYVSCSCLSIYESGSRLSQKTSLLFFDTFWSSSGWQFHTIRSYCI